jgi:hypothetical protein
MLRILHIPDDEDVEMRKLVLRLGETSEYDDAPGFVR